MYKKFTSCFSLLALVLGSLVSNLSCSANQVGKDSNSKTLNESLCLANSKKNSGPPNNFLQKVKILAKEKPAVVVVPASVSLLTLVAAAVAYSLRKKNPQETSKSTNNTSSTSSEDGAFLEEDDVTKKAPTDEIADENKNINVSEDKSSVTQSSNIEEKIIDTNENVESYDGGKNDSGAAKSTNDAVDVNSGDSTSKSEYPKYIEITKWWCFWSVLLFFHFATLLGILTVIFFSEAFSFKILWNIFGFLAPFITFCVDPILNILNIPYSLKMFLEGAIFTFFALIFTIVDFALLTDFIHKNARLIVKGKDTLLAPWWYILFMRVVGKYNTVDAKGKETIKFEQVINEKYSKLKVEHKKRLIETYEALNGVESKK